MSVEFWVALAWHSTHGAWLEYNYLYCVRINSLSHLIWFLFCLFFISENNHLYELLWCELENVLSLSFKISIKKSTFFRNNKLRLHLLIHVSFSFLFPCFVYTKEVNRSWNIFLLVSSDIYVLNLPICTIISAF